MIKNRIIFEELLKQKDSHKISLLIGARQVGKTTLLKQLYPCKSKLIQANSSPSKPTKKLKY